MTASNTITASDDAALRCNFNFVSNQAATGKSNIENNNPNKRGHNTSLPKILIKTKAIIAISIAASLA